MSTLRDAATILLLRDRPKGGFEVFMVRRHGQSGFMAGATVFPGGKLDEQDKHARLHARLPKEAVQSAQTWLGEDDVEAATAVGLMVAAIRETFEEAGVLLADVAVEADLRAARRALNEGRPFADVLDMLDARLRVDELAPLSRWITPEVEPRRFDTRFFVAKAPRGQVAEHDQRETTEAAWLAPTEAIARMEAGALQLPPPTLKTLLTIAEHRNSDDVIAYARSRRPPRVAPVIQQVEGLLSVLLPGDPLHPDETAAFEGSTRIVLDNGRFWAK